MNRYARQIMLPQLGTSGQAAFGAAHILVVGCGGLAAPALPLLAGAGIGRLTLIDPDLVELSNLHRQTLFTEADCGAPKAQIAAARCQAINSGISVQALDTALTPANAPALIAQADIVLDCADSYAVSYILSDLCLTHNTALISASALGLGGYVGGFCGTAPSLRAVFPDAPDQAATCATAGVLGPVVAHLGVLQAQMALSVIAGLGPSPLGQMVQFDGQSLLSTGFRFDTAPEPTTAFAFVDPKTLSAEDRLIVDLRPVDEAPVPAHPQAQRLGRDAILQHPAKRLALCCQTGLRAWRMAEEIAPYWSGEIVLVAASAS